MTIKTINNKTLFKFDETDKKIFYYLSQNIRHPRKDLAKLLCISPEKLNYRIERFLKNVIEPIILINFPLFGIKSYLLFIKQQLDKDTIKRIEKLDEIYLFTQCLGKYHHVLHIVTNDLENFMYNNLGDILIEEIYEIKNYIPDNYNGFKVKVKILNEKKTFNKIKITSKHNKIIKELIKNPLESYLQLSIDTGIDRRQVAKIVKSLYENDYIQKFRYILNSYKTGFETYLLKIHYNYAAKKKLIKELRSNNYSGFIYETQCLIFMWYLPKAHDELFDFVSNLETKFDKIKIDTIQPTDLYTLNFMPKYVLQQHQKL